MSESDTDSSGLLAGIEQEAREEADRIIQETRRMLDERRKATDLQIEKILITAQEKADAQAEVIRGNSGSRIAVETRRLSLRARDELMRDVLTQARRKLESLIKTEAYRSIVAGWVVEAAVGLNVPAASVRASAGELSLIDKALLKEAERKVKEVTGKTVKLEIAPGRPLREQGVVLTAKDGRLAFNNQVQTRLMRYDSEIRRIIYGELKEL